MNFAHSDNRGSYQDPRGKYQNPFLGALADSVVAASKSFQPDRGIFDLSEVCHQLERVGQGDAVPEFVDPVSVPWKEAVAFLNGLDKKFFETAGQVLVVNVLGDRTQVFHGTVLSREKDETVLPVEVFELRLHHTPSECPALTLGAKVYIDPDFSRNDAVIMYSMARGRDFSNHPLWAALGDAILASDLSLEDYQEQFGYRRLREACIANAKYNALGDSRGIGNEDLDRPLRVFELISSPKGLLRETLSSAPDSQVEMRVMIACGGLQFGSTLEGLLRELEIHRNNRRFDLANIAVLDVLVHKDMMKSCFDRMPGQELSPEAISCKLFFGGLVDLGMKGHEEFVRGLRITDEKSFDATFEKLKALLSLELRPLAELEHQV